MTKIYKTASLIIVALMLSVSAYAQQVIQNRTYESGEQEQRNTSSSISTADNVLVKPAAKVDWESLSKIHLTPGFRAQPGANFHAVVPDPDAFVLVALDGDNQSAAPGEVNARPFDLAVWQHQAPVINMPVTLTVLSGGGSLMSASTSGGVNTLTLMSDSVGTVQAWFRQPVANNVTSVIRATSNGKILDLHSYNFETSLAYGNGRGESRGQGDVC